MLVMSIGVSVGVGSIGVSEVRYLGIRISTDIVVL